MQDADGFELLRCNRCLADKPASLFAPSMGAKTDAAKRRCIKCVSEALKEKKPKNVPLSPFSWEHQQVMHDGVAVPLFSSISRRKV